jgi:putative transposase
MEGWNTPEEQQTTDGIKRRAFFKRLKRGLYETKYIPSPNGGGKNGQQLLVRPKQTTIPEPALGTRRVERGEPGCHVVTPFVNGEPAIGQIGQIGPIGQIKGEAKQDGPTLLGQAPSAPAVLGPPGDPGADVEQQKALGVRREAQGEKNEINQIGQIGQIGPMYNDIPSQARKIPESCQKVANLRYALLEKFNEDLNKNHRPKTEIVKQFLDLYNSGLLAPEIFKGLGTISRATLYNWASAGTLHGRDGLIPAHRGAGGSIVTDHEKNFLLTLLLHQNRLKVGYAIRLLKDRFQDKNIETHASPATLRRFVDQFRKDHFDIWTLRRDGEKALADKVLPYIERDRNLLDVGEGLVADGHRLNFQVVNPFTGKPCRASMVLFWDWRSAYPLGWEIMLEENIQCISSALRNAILTLGKTPKWILMDNGKAFKAKVFTSDLDLTDTEISGMFARLNINVHFSQPYNAQAKPIERFWGIQNEWFERLQPSYTGASIEDKPAWTKRNEKIARSLHEEWVPEIPEVNEMLSGWREFYAGQPSKGLDGDRPGDVFQSGKGPGIDPSELTYLMMPREIKDLHRNGFTLFDCHWNDENLYGYRHPILIKYSLSDLSQIYCFTLKNEFLCAARPVPKCNPMASESGNPKDMEEVKRQNAQKRSLKNQTVKLYRMLGMKAGQALPWKEIVSEVPDVVRQIEKIESQKKIVRISPFVEEPERTEDSGLRTEETIEERRTELSGPAFRFESERYDWYMAQDLASLNQADLGWMEEYKQSAEWRSYYGQKQAQGGAA